MKKVHESRRIDNFQKVLDGRRQPIRGLWERNGRFYARLTFESPDNASGLSLALLLFSSSASLGKRNPIALESIRTASLSGTKHLALCVV